MIALHVVHLYDRLLRTSHIQRLTGFGGIETVGVVRSVGGGIQRLAPRIFHAESLVWIYLHGLGKKELLPHFFTAVP